MVRNHRITVRLTKEQYQEIEKRRGQIPRSEYLYLLLLDYLKRELQIDRSLQQIAQRQELKNKHCQNLYRELAKIGGNINQIARALNKKHLTKKEKEHLLNLLNKTTELVEKTLQTLKEIPDGTSQKN
jgi:hypothetical protein